MNHHPTTLQASRLLSVLSAAILLPVAAHAASGTLALYNFTTDPSNSANLPAPLDSTYTVGFGYGPSYTGVGSAAGWSSGGGNVFARATLSAASSTAVIARGTETGVTATDQATVAATGSYFTFTLAPTEGYTVSFSSITAQVSASRLTHTETVPAYTAQFFLRSSVDNFTATLGTASSSMPAGTAGQNAWSTLTTTDLSSISALTDVATPVTFRLYAFITTDTASYYQAIRVDDFAIVGSTQVIPEPSTFALLGGLAVLSCAALRRRRRA